MPAVAVLDVVPDVRKERLPFLPQKGRSIREIGVSAESCLTLANLLLAISLIHLRPNFY